MEKREFRKKLANAFKDNHEAEIGYFLAYLQGYLDHEEEGKFQELMLQAINGTDIEKSFNA